MPINFSRGTKVIVAITTLVLIAIGGVWYAGSGGESEARIKARMEAEQFTQDFFAKKESVPVESYAQAQYEEAVVAEELIEEVSEEEEVVVEEEVIIKEPEIMTATLYTSEGEITIQFFSEDAPNTVANFIKLAKSGYYNGTRFHRVIAQFMIQGGDPLTKTLSQSANWGTGGPGYTFADEIHANNKNLSGTISMANSGPDTNGSQFFINTVNNSSLDKKHTVFGKVTDGMEVVKKIEYVQTNQNDRPINPVMLTKVTVN